MHETDQTQDAWRILKPKIKNGYVTFLLQMVKVNEKCFKTE